MAALLRAYSFQKVFRIKKSLQETNAAARKAQISVRMTPAHTAASTATQMHTKVKRRKHTTITRKKVPFWAIANPSQTNGLKKSSAIIPEDAEISTFANFDIGKSTATFGMAGIFCHKQYSFFLEAFPLVTHHYSSQIQMRKDGCLCQHLLAHQKISQ